MAQTPPQPLRERRCASFGEPAQARSPLPRRASRPRAESDCTWSPKKTRPHRRPDVLAPGCGSIMFTETPGNRPGDVARENATAGSCGPETTNDRLDRRHGSAWILRASVMSRDHDGPTLHTIHNTARPAARRVRRRRCRAAVLSECATGADVPRTATGNFNARPSHEVPRRQVAKRSGRVRRLRREGPPRAKARRRLPLRDAPHRRRDDPSGHGDGRGDGLRRCFTRYRRGHEC
mmetsp:Transcript_11617/g.30350  ORF Transcript_11617/g.30350 Transcript_11617/m.30350 type:complete len:235 (-) Transcript_11617:517-1221(-)